MDHANSRIKLGKKILYLVSSHKSNILLVYNDIPFSGYKSDVLVNKLAEYMEMFVIGLILEEQYFYLKEVCAKVTDRI